jgi:WD40 repeat protein
VRVWDSGKLLLTLAGHDDGVTALTFVAGGAVLVSGSRDGTARVWDVESGQLSATFAHLGAGEWAAITAGDVIDHSAAAAHHLAWMAGGKRFPFESMTLKDWRDLRLQRTAFLQRRADRRRQRRRKP